MKLVTLYLPETYIKALDRLVDEHFTLTAPPQSEQPSAT